MCPARCLGPAFSYRQQQADQCPEVCCVALTDTFTIFKCSSSCRNLSASFEFLFQRALCPRFHLFK